MFLEKAAGSQTAAFFNKKREMKTAVKQIIFGDIGQSLARYYPHNNTIVVEPRKWAALPYDQRMMILLHEAGHATANTREEIEADNWALKAYLSLGLPLTQALNTIADNLPENNKTRAPRVQNLFNKLAKYDLNHNHNKKILELNQINQKDMYTPQFYSFESNSSYGSSFFGGEDYDSIFGLSKKERDARLERKKIKAEAKANVNNAKANAINATGQIPQSGVAGFFGGLLGKASNLIPGVSALGLGQGGDAPAAQNMRVADAPAETKPNYLLYGGIALVIVVVAWFFLKKKGKK